LTKIIIIQVSLIENKLYFTFCLRRFANWMGNSVNWKPKYLSHFLCCLCKILL